MRKLILWLTHFKILRTVVRELRLLSLANAWLRCFPVVKRLPGTGIRYRARRVESLALSVEMFDKGYLYSTVGLPSPINTFADLGCNVGYFTCWLGEHVKNRQIKGLMVDANSEAVEDAQWHVKANQLANVHAMHGLVGVASKTGSSDFFLHNTSNVCSTTTLAKEELEKGGNWTRVQIPCINLEEKWKTLVGDVPCDLLKVDIEGSEMDFFRNEPQFVDRTKAILIEWHKYRVTYSEVETLLNSRGFLLKKILSECDLAGTALFVRKA